MDPDEKIAEIAEIPTSDDGHTESTEITASLASAKFNHIRYTADELLMLRPASISPSASEQDQVKAPVQAPVQAHVQANVQAPTQAATQAATQAPTPEKDSAPAEDIKIEAQQKPEKDKATKAVAFQDEDKADQELHGYNAEKPLENTDANAEDPVNPTEDQVTPADGVAPEPAEGEKKKKKKKSSGQKARGKTPKPTGFEEFYADPPITPAEYNEEINELYH
jgi:hypothetical protein